MSTPGRDRTTRQLRVPEEPQVSVSARTHRLPTTPWHQRTQWANQLTFNLIAMVVTVVFTRFGGWLSDRLGRSVVLGVSSAVIALLAYPLFLAVSTGSVASAIVSSIAAIVERPCRSMGPRTVRRNGRALVISPPPTRVPVETA